MEDFNLWQKFINSNYGKRATLPIQYLLGNRDSAEQFIDEDMGRFADLLLSTTKPFRTGANILAQNYGSAFTGQDMSQSENQGGFLKWLAGGITPEEQDYINRKPYMAAIKSGAGIASTFLPFASRGVAATTLLPRALQVAGRGLIEGLPAGLAYSREGKELQDTAVGGVMGAGGELLGEILTNPSFRKMLTDASTYVDPSTGGRMYRGALGNDDDILFSNDLSKVPETPKDLGADIENLAEFTNSNNPDSGMDLINIDLEDTKYPPVDIPDDIEITNYQDYDNPIINLEAEAKKYATPDEFVKAQGKPIYHGGSGVEELSREFRIATPEEKLKFSSSGGGYEGLSFSTDRDIAKNYSRNIGNTDEVFEGFINPNAKVKRIDLKGDTPDDLDLEALRRQGYDAIQDIGDQAEKEFRALTEKAIITKSQLQDIWRKAHNLKASAKELRGGFEEILRKSGIK